MNRIWTMDLRIIAGTILFIAALLFALGRMPGGIGGTGITVQPGGIGGTGIFGRIDKFGSIWVNDVEIHYPDDMLVSKRAGDKTTGDLALGQVVAVVTDDISGRIEARSIRIIEEVVGPVQAKINASGEVELTVLGQSVRLSPDTVMALPMDDLQKNDMVLAVSGFRDENGIIFATRLVSVAKDSPQHVRGIVSDPDDSGFSVGALRIDSKDVTYEKGNIIIVDGQFVDGSFKVAAIEVQPALPFPKSVAAISVQGIYTTDENGKSHVSGVALQETGDVSGRDSDQPQKNRVIVTGLLDSSGDMSKIDVKTIGMTTSEKPGQNEPLQSDNLITDILPLGTIIKELDKSEDTVENAGNAAREAEDAAEDGAKAAEEAEEGTTREAERAAQDAVEEAEKAAQEATKEAERAAQDAVKDAEDAAQDEAEDAAQDEAEDAAQEEAEDAAQDEAEDAAQDEAEDAAQDEAEDAAQDEAEDAAQEEAEQAAQEEAEQAAQEEAEDAAQDEAEDAAQDEAEQAAQEEAEQTAQEEAERAAQEEAEQAAQEEAERAAQEEAEQAAQEEAEQAAQEEAEQAAQEEAERAAQEEAERAAQEEAERAAQEEAERAAQEEAEQAAQEEAERAAQEAAEDAAAEDPVP